MTHTPGPWKWTVGDPQTMMLHGEPDYISGSLLWCDRCKACAERDAQCGWPKKEDANLIAAAPELLDALKECKQFLDHGPEFPLHLSADAEDLQEQVHKAIAKAEGGE